jgi:hypothetical protein
MENLKDNELVKSYISNKRGRKNSYKKTLLNTSDSGTKQGERRYSFILEIELIDKFNQVCKNKKLYKKDLMNKILKTYLNENEQSI